MHGKVPREAVQTPGNARLHSKLAINVLFCLNAAGVGESIG